VNRLTVPGIKQAWGRVLFRLRGGNRLDGCEDEPAARAFHLLLAAFLVWMGVMQFVLVPLFAVRRVAGGVLILLLGGFTVAALVLLRRSRKRASAFLFLCVFWCVLGTYSVFSGGVLSQGPYMQFVVILDAAWLLGLAPALGFAGATLLLSLAEAVLQYTGHAIPMYFPNVAPIGRWGIQVAIAVLTVGPVIGFLETMRAQISALRDSEDRFRSLSDASLEGIMIHNTEVILDSNLAFARVFGYDRPDELIGRNPIEILLTPESQARIRERLERGEIGVLEVTCIRRDGTPFPAETESRAMKFQGRDARLVTCRDITVRKRAMEAQRESEERYKALFERSLDCVFLFDLEGNLLDANKAALDVLGYQREDIARLSLASLLPPDQLALTSQRMQQILTQGYLKERHEYRFRREGGGEIFVETQASLIYRDDKPVAIQSIGRDITERKRAEAERAKLEAQLNEARKMESIGRLAGGIAHDFNNLLTVINGYSDVLMHQLDSQRRKYAEQINKAGESAASLTRQLLAFSRMEVTHPQSVLLNHIVAESGDMLERLVGQHIEMKTSLGAAPDRVLADPNQIHQCLMNLAVNARDAMPAGGLLTIETGNVEVAQHEIPPGTNGAPGPHVRLTVRDTGIGMDEETSQRIFEPFFTTKEKGRGTGLGLSTVYGIVSQWQGFLKVGSEPGKGSEFTIHLPLDLSVSTQPNAPAAESGKPPAASETVLVVEDQDIVREFVVESLRMSGYTVLEARNGAEALKIIQSNGAAIDLMMTDVLMPGMRGKELAARAHAVCPSLKVLFMTGYADGSIDDNEDGHDGKAEVLMKPFSPEALEARVRDMLHPNPKTGVRPRRAD
jgi:two-component system, cell cycle sensor histidine kinase and response regulator CckA